ncbi:MAG: hypothetical protein WA397_13110 [Roseiarcus sp.]
MTKPTSTDRIESARKILNAPASTVAELEAARAVLTHVFAETDAEVEEMRHRRKTIAASDASIAEIEKALKRHDADVLVLTDRNDIAAAVAAKLDERIAADRETESAAKRQAAYNDARAVHDAATRRVKEFLDRIGLETRQVMRAYSASEMKTAAVNSDLPAGAVPIPSIEAERKGKLRPPKTTVREFKAFVDGRILVGEQGHVQAAERKDGKWDVFLPAGTTGGGSYFVCSLENYVEVMTETHPTPWPENLAMSLSVPAFSVTEHPGWTPRTDNLGPVFPDQIAIELDRLESSPPFQFEPRVDRRVMSSANWRRLNGETIEADPPRAQVAAE